MDDQQAREAAAKELFTTPGAVIEDMWERIASINPAQADEWRADASRVIDAYLAALPVAPEQPTQANGELLAAVRVAIKWLSPRKDARASDSDRARAALEAALVSSPSLETVTPDRETIVREVIDWIQNRAPHSRGVAVSEAREHFGVSS